MKNNYQEWLVDQRYASGTVTAQLHRAGRVEECYGDLDEHFQKDRLVSVINELKYSMDDERQNRPNPSKIPFNGNIRTNLASYRDATKRYVRFRDDNFDGTAGELSTNSLLEVSGEKAATAKLFGLERDMQRELRNSIEQLEEGLEIIDDGAERSVDSGFIDITAKDPDGNIVIIELKAGKARKDALGQILGYMGDVVEEEPGSNIRGILVASDFDSKVKSGATIIPSLTLKKYAINFEFIDS